MKQTRYNRKTVNSINHVSAQPSTTDVQWSLHIYTLYLYCSSTMGNLLLQTRTVPGTTSTRAHEHKELKAKKTQRDCLEQIYTKVYTACVCGCRCGSESPTDQVLRMQTIICLVQDIELACMRGSPCVCPPSLTGTLTLQLLYIPGSKPCMLMLIYCTLGREK